MRIAALLASWRAEFSAFFCAAASAFSTSACSRSCFFLAWAAFSSSFFFFVAAAAARICHVVLGVSGLSVARTVVCCALMLARRSLESDVEYSSNDCTACCWAVPPVGAFARLLIHLRIASG